MMDKYRASIALPTVVLISSILLIGGLSIIIMSIDIRKSTKGFSEYTTARLEAQACLEEGIEDLKFDSTYTGSFSMTFPSGSCDITISNIGGDPTLKEAVITSSHGDTDYEAKYEIDVSAYPLTVSKL